MSFDAIRPTDAKREYVKQVAPVFEKQTVFFTANLARAIARALFKRRKAVAF